jgi:hypothetical protein
MAINKMPLFLSCQVIIIELYRYELEVYDQAFALFLSVAIYIPYPAYLHDDMISFTSMPQALLTEASPWAMI